MADLQCTVKGDFNELLAYLEQGFMDSSFSATLEARGDFAEGGARLAVRVFEQYSVLGGNRMSLTLTLFQNGGDIQVYAVGSGASSGMFFKINTWSEEGLVNDLENLLHKFERKYS